MDLLKALQAIENAISPQYWFKMRGSTAVILCALALLCLAQDNFQERKIYLNEDDNPCHINYHERVNLVIHISDKPTIKAWADTTTLCVSDIIVPEYAIRPSIGFNY